MALQKGQWGWQRSFLGIWYRVMLKPVRFDVPLPAAGAAPTNEKTNTCFGAMRPEAGDKNHRCQDKLMMLLVRTKAEWISSGLNRCLHIGDGSFASPL